MRDKSLFHAVPKWLRELAAMILALIVILPVLVLFLHTIFYIDSNGCRGECICDLLGVDDKRSAVELLGAALTTLSLGFLALLGLWVANRRAVAMDKTAETQTKTVKGDKERRIQERFRDAIEHLGNESESVRCGGAYTLFHLALEEENLRQSIARILCVHIQKVTRNKNYRRDYRNNPSTEIQFLMTLLFEERDANRSATLKQFWNGINPDLSGGFFRGIKLEKAQFQGALLSNAQFQGAKISESQFQGANLFDAQFQEAILREAQFQGKNFQGVQFQGAILRKARFQEGDFLQAEFQGSDLREAKFQGSSLQRSQFQGTRLQKVQFQGADLSWAQFQGAVLLETEFQEVTFVETKFQGVHCSGAGFQMSGSKPIRSSFFRRQIQSRIRKESNLSRVIFVGRLKEEEIDIAHTLPDGVKEGEYSQEEAEQWIADYEKAMNWKKDT